MTRYYSHGKLLLTGEYLVLDGAQSLAIPCKFGQDLTVKTNASNRLSWSSLDKNNKVWFEDKFSIIDGQLTSEHRSRTSSSISERLIDLLNAARKLNSDFLTNHSGYEIHTQLEFPREWGLGTSSTLVNNIARWAKVDPYRLSDLTFGGSGYDIACAEAITPITYQLTETSNKDSKRLITSVSFDPPFKNNLYFLHLNQKQDSRKGIAQYKAHRKDTFKVIPLIDAITEAIINCKALDDFQKLIEEHETIVSKVIHQNTIKQDLFNDFSGSLKSLGAWGGDFILVASEQNPLNYFKNKGFNTLITYDDMVL